MGMVRVRLSPFMWLPMKKVATIFALGKIFQSQNPSRERTRTILTDKDLIEWKVYDELFTAATLQSCLFHVLCSMKHDIHCEKMGITLGQKITHTFCLILIDIPPLQLPLINFLYSYNSGYLTYLINKLKSLAYFKGRVSWKINNFLT